MRLLLLFAVGALLLAACGGPSAPPTPVPTNTPKAPPASPTAEASATPVATPAPRELNNVEIADKLRPSTVFVEAKFGETAIEPEELGSGTGIVYDTQNGYILTA